MYTPGRAHVLVLTSTPGPAHVYSRPSRAHVLVLTMAVSDCWLLTCLLAPRFTIATITFSVAMNGNSWLTWRSITYHKTYIHTYIHTIIHKLYMVHLYTVLTASQSCAGANRPSSVAAHCLDMSCSQTSRGHPPTKPCGAVPHRLVNSSTQVLINGISQSETVTHT